MWKSWGHKAPTTASTSNQLPEGMRHNWNIKSWTAADIKNRLTEVLTKIRTLYDQAGTADMRNLSFSTLIDPLLDVQRLTFGYNWWYGTLGSTVVFPKLISVSKEVRDAATEAENAINELTLEMCARKDIFERLLAYKKFCKLQPENMRYVDRMITMAKRNGLELEDEQQSRLQELLNNINVLVSEFEQNVNEDKSFILLSDVELAGVHYLYIRSLDIDRESGLRKCTMNVSCYLPIMRKCRNAESRRKLNTAYLNVGGRRNEEIMQQVIAMRQECANLLGYENWAAYRLEMNMAKDTETVSEFLTTLASKLQPLWEREKAAFLKLKEEECKKFRYHFNNQLDAWDLPYYSNMLEEKKYAIDTDLIKVYFPLETVTNGMLGIYSHLLGVHFAKLVDPPTWHESVFVYKVNDKESGELMGYVYMDLFPRPGKFFHFGNIPMQSGALNENGVKDKTITCMVCNFTPPASDLPSLLTPADVEAYFHEFGHAMHVICCKAKNHIFWGLHVEMDFLEAPSQMLENWAKEKEVLSRMSGHFQTGAKIPDALVQKIRNARNANAGYSMLRQIVLATFDQRIHQDGSSNPREVYRQTLQEIMGLETSPDTFLPGAFVHAMKSYDAAYYSYLYSEVFSADMYETVFGEAGPMDATAGKKYRKEILEKGGSVDGMDMLRNFLGREPNQEAFLRSRGLLPPYQH